MSTVLEAQRQQQRGAAGVAERAPAATPRSWRPPRRLIAFVTIALLGVLLLVISRPNTRRTEPAAAPAPLPPVQAAPAQAAPVQAAPVQAAPVQAAPAAPPAVHSVVTEEPPRGRVTENTLAALQPNAVSKAKRVPAAKPQAETHAKASRRAEAPAKASRQAEAPAKAAAPALPGAGGVRLKSIHYATASPNRTVTLLIGTETATLHEGESVGGLEVQLILQDMVYIRNGGSVSAIAASP